MQPNPADYLAETFTRSAFRLETRPHYDVGADPGLRRWRKGRTPDWDMLNGWLRVLESERERGLNRQRIKIVSSALTEHEQYVCEHLLPYAVGAGERIAVVDRAEVDVPGDLPLFDFWLLDDERALRLRYDRRGRFQDAEPLRPGLVRFCAAVRDTLAPLAVPFEQWWLQNTGEPLPRSGPAHPRPLRWRADLPASVAS